VSSDLSRRRALRWLLSLAVLTVFAVVTTWLPLIPGLESAAPASASSDPAAPSQLCGPSSDMSVTAGASGGSGYGSLWLPNQATVSFSVSGSILPENWVGNGRGQYYLDLYLSGTAVDTHGTVADVGIVWGPGPYPATAFPTVQLGTWQNTSGQAQSFPIRLDVTRSYAGLGISPSLHMTVTGGQQTTTSAPCLNAGESAGSNPSENNCPGNGGDPVNLATGNFHEDFVDFDIPGRGRSLSTGHSYNSLFATVNGPLGYGWTSDFLMSLSFVGDPASPTNVIVNQENGSQVTFDASGGSFSAPPRVLASLSHNGDGSWSFVRRGWSRFQFNSGGKLVSISDPVGADHTTTVNYDGFGQISTVQDAAGRTLTYSWVSGRIHTITDQASRQVRFEFDANTGDLIDAFDVRGGDTHFTYVNHFITRIQSPQEMAGTLHKELVNVYDSAGRVASQADENNHTTSFDWTVPLQTTVTDPRGNVSTLVYDNLTCTSLTLAVGTPEQGTWTFAHDPNTLGVTQVKDPLTRVVATVGYDSAGNATYFKDGVGNESSAAYNSFGEPVWVKDGKQVTTTFGYDPTRGTLQSVSTPLLESSPQQTRLVSLFYDDTNHPGDATRVVDPNSKTWQLGYDAYGYSSSVTDPLGNKTTTQFDSYRGWPNTMVTPKGNVAGANASLYTWTFGHNPSGQLTSVVSPQLPDGSHATTSYDYDRNGNLTSFIDPEHQYVDAQHPATPTIYQYDDANQLKEVDRADGSKQYTTYWEDGSVHTRVDTANQTTSYDYDHQGRLKTVTAPASNTTTRTTAYVYADATSSVVSKQDPGGNCAVTPAVGCTTYTHDAAGQLKSVIYSDGVTPNVTNIGYDANGRWTTMDSVGAAAQAQWSWDSLGRLMSSVDENGVSTSYGHDLAGHLTSIAYPAGTVNRHYDDAGRFDSTTDWLNNTTSFHYDPNSNLDTTTFPTGTANVDSYGFDNADRQTSTTMTKSGATSASLTYDRFKTGLLKTITTVNLPGASSTSYGYNSLNQLTTVAGATSYGYDSADNLTQMLGSAYQEFDAAHQLCWQAATSASGCTPPAGATTFSYDGRGNRTAMSPPGGDVPTFYAYDQANRLTSVTVPSSTGDTGQYTPLPAARIMDTHPGSLVGDCGAGAGSCATFGPGTSESLQVTGKGGIPTSGVDSVVLNVASSNSTDAASFQPWAGSGAPGLTLRSAPTVATPTSDIRDVFAVTTDGSIRTVRYTGGAWGAWQSLGGLTWCADNTNHINCFAPSVVVLNGNEYVFVTGFNDNKVYVDWKPISSGSWSGWAQVTGNYAIKSAPTAISPTGGTIDLFGTGGDGAVWTSRNSSVASSLTTGFAPNWSSLGGSLWCADATNHVNCQAPAAVLFNGNEQLFATAAASRSLYQNYRPAPNGSWSGWNAIAGTADLRSAPVGVSPVGGTLDVYGVGLNGAVYTTRWTNLSQTWSAWVPMPAGTSYCADQTNVWTCDTPGAVSFNNEEDVFITGTDNGLWKSWRPADAVVPDGHVTVYPTGSARPGTASLVPNKTPNETVNNTVVAKVGTGGKIDLYSSVGTNLTVDVEGWYSSPTGQTNGNVFTAINPIRAMNTTAGSRVGNCTTGNATCATMTAGSGTQNLKVTSPSAEVAGVPSGASAVVVNVTVQNTATAGDLTVWPKGATKPTVPNVTWLAGDKTANLVITGLSSDGQLSFATSSSGNVDVIADVEGYYTAASNGGGTNFTPVTQTRLVDTRPAPYTTGTCTPSPCQRFAAGATKKLQITGTGTVPAGATAVVANVTAISASAAGSLTFWAGDVAQQPSTTDLRIDTVNESQSVTAVIPLGADGSININSTIATDLTVDVQGYYTPAQGKWSYGYNSTGLRKSKTSPTGATTSFTWSQAGDLPMLTSETTGSASMSYVYGPGGLAVEQISTVSGTNTVRYLHHDQLGSTRQITDASGNVVGSYTYDPFGKLAAGATGTGISQFGFAGQYTDAETGFQYLRNRYYDPSTGQFLTRDPIEALTGDPYGYAYNSPLNFTDPAGLSPLDVVGDALHALQCAVEATLGFIGDHIDGILQIVAVIAVVAIIAIVAPMLIGDGLAVEEMAALLDEPAEAAVADEGGGLLSSLTPVDWADDTGALGQPFTGDQDALVQLAKSAKRTGIDQADAQTLVDWAHEVGLEGRGPEVHPGRPWGRFPHIHVGPINHIPVL
jgi:RHS repeat-associated protein